MKNVVIFQEGIVHTLQTHSVGNGIKSSDHGDGFTRNDPDGFGRGVNVII